MESEARHPVKCGAQLLDELLGEHATAANGAWAVTAGRRPAAQERIKRLPRDLCHRRANSPRSSRLGVHTVRQILRDAHGRRGCLIRPRRSFRVLQTLEEPCFKQGLLEVRLRLARDVLQSHLRRSTASARQRLSSPDLAERPAPEHSRTPESESADGHLHAGAARLLVIWWHHVERHGGRRHWSWHEGAWGGHIGARGGHTRARSRHERTGGHWRRRRQVGLRGRSGCHARRGAAGRRRVRAVEAGHRRWRGHVARNPAGRWGLHARHWWCVRRLVGACYHRTRWRIGAVR